MKKSKFFFAAALLTVIVLYVSDPAKYMASFTDGLTVWAKSVVPALFPFFLFSKFLIELNFFNGISKRIAPAIKKLFNAPEISGNVFVLSVVSGYPVGAKLIAEYHAKGLISNTGAKKIATFTSTSGPLFILGTVAGGFFGNPALGWMLLACHVLSAVVCGLLFRGFFNGEKELLTKSALTTPLSKNLLNDAVYSSISGILSVGAFISVFYVLTDMLLSVNLLSLFPDSVSQSGAAFLAGLVEVTRGCRDLSVLGLSTNAAAVATGFLISFGGFCVMLQSLCFLSKCGVTLKHLLAVKSVQASVTAIFTALLLFLFPL